MKHWPAIAIGVLLSGCAVHNQSVWEPAQSTRPTPATVKLQALPPAGERVAIAVYNFADQTGQFKPSDSVQTLSRAVTQGATSILVKALQEAGNQRWFTVIERERLDNLLRERAVIREMRSAYLGERTLNRQALPPLLFAGVLLEGGIIGYDSNTKTGGAGARFLGIGGSTQYREDTVTVYLRAVSVKTGEVLSTISVRKSIASVGINANAFRFVAFKDLLELETGITYNEPDVLALQQAIEAAVYGLIVEGSVEGLWCFDIDAPTAEGVVRSYYARRDDVDAKRVQLALRPDGKHHVGTCEAPKSIARLAPKSVVPAPAVARPTPTSSGPIVVAPAAVQDTEVLLRKPRPG
ncbi:curlin [Sphingomonas sp. Leaf34]|uniref:CsgG/HfaB family protein n=1 Tax=Sphingomonas sp. Leaf34 TaxID=1736216 RepID=UPI0006F434FB|nr:CsgG/HfaB family protein [Sphingomonas sp. Leaf34]KQN30300.1 curlin [Sphingomonas sp. Leaf34]